MKGFQEFHTTYSKDLYNYLFYLTNDRLLAEELMQETFYQAFTSIHRFKGQSTVKTWLYQIGKHVYAKHVRKNPAARQAFDERDTCSANFSNPETIVLKEDQENRLHQAIEQLSDPYKQVVILRSFHEWNYKEIAEMYMESENWARVTFHRGKQKLRQMLKRGSIPDEM